MIVRSLRPIPSSATTVDDDELVATIRAGNLSALGTLFDRYGATSGVSSCASA